ncbi:MULTISPECIES: hypothetical protein [Bacillus cereus group]|nr:MULTISPECIES: hypothetical protein [Bacillus cereus group]EMA6341700.1 hypothetical protein [Bacillus cytotoxicus]QTR79163.1 hypothetical protein JC773_00815 [Bacillus cytotoxicus]
MKKIRNQQQKKQNKQQKEEKLSIRDIEELMGVRRPRYERGHGGALRQK